MATSTRSLPLYGPRRGTICNAEGPEEGSRPAQQSTFFTSAAGRRSNRQLPRFRWGRSPIVQDLQGRDRRAQGRRAEGVLLYFAPMAAAFRRLHVFFGQAKEPESAFSTIYLGPSRVPCNSRKISLPVGPSRRCALGISRSTGPPASRKGTGAPLRRPKPVHRQTKLSATGKIDATAAPFALRSLSGDGLIAVEDFRDPVKCRLYGQGSRIIPLHRGNSTLLERRGSSAPKGRRPEGARS